MEKQVRKCTCQVLDVAIGTQYHRDCHPQLCAVARLPLGTEPDEADRGKCLIPGKMSDDTARNTRTASMHFDPQKALCRASVRHQVDRSKNSILKLCLLYTPSGIRPDRLRTL